MGDACATCDGRGKVPAVKGAYDRWLPCPTCKGSGGRRPADQR